MDELKRLWHTVFGDDFEIIDSFFHTFYAPELTAAEYFCGKTAAAAYVLPAGYMINGNTREKCAHIYAVAVYPEFRGKGLGVAVTNRAVALAKEAGYTCIILHPANEGLFGFYSVHCNFKNAFSANIYEVRLSPRGASPALSDTATYNQARERYLQGIPHVELNCEILSFFQNCGGKLYVFDNGCAAVEVSDGATYFRELLGNVTESELASVAETARCIITSPGGDIPTGMMHGTASVQSSWIGLTLE